MVTLLLNSWTGGHFKIWIFSRTSYLYKNDSKKQTKFDFLLCSRNIIWDDCREFHNVLRLYGHLKTRKDIFSNSSMHFGIFSSFFSGKWELKTLEAFKKWHHAWGTYCNSQRKFMSETKLRKYFVDSRLFYELNHSFWILHDLWTHLIFYTRTCLLTSTLIDALEEGRNQWYKRQWCLHL